MADYGIVLTGTDDANILRGTDRNDYLYGGKGNDTLRGGAGDDWLEGGEGSDLLFGREGADTLDGGAGDDHLYGGEGDDRLQGRAGNDLLTGGAGDDGLYGGAGDDRLYGREGNDGLDGDEGDDTLYGDGGDDTLYGSAGNDLLDGDEGNDKLYGGTGDDRLYGGAGDDRLEGRAGNDKLYGGTGDDRLYGGTGDDRLWGAEGDDQLYGGAGDGDDTLVGGNGDDRLEGGAGADTLTGGAGTDIFRFNRGDSLGNGDVITDFTVAGANRDALDLRAFNIDLTRDLKSQGLTLSDLMDADGDGATDDRKITLPDGGTITLLNLGDVALAIDDFTFAGDGGALTNVDAGDDPEDQPGPDPEGNGGALTNVDADDGDDGAYNSRYELFSLLEPGDEFQLYFLGGVERTSALPSNATAAAIAAALEALDGVTDAEVTGGSGIWWLTITADTRASLEVIEIGVRKAWHSNIELEYLGGNLYDYADESPPEDQPDPEPEAQPGPDPEGQPGPEPGGNGGALTNVDAGDGGRSHLQEVVTSGGLTGRLDAGDLSIGGGVALPASDDGLHRSNYHLYYHAEGGSYFLRFDDAITADLPVSATAAQVDAALEGLDGVTSAEVSGEPGNFTIALMADEPHVLQWGDLRLDGDGQLDYLAEPPADDGDGDGGALTNVDAGDEPEDQPDPDPEAQPGPDPEGNGRALTGALTNVEAGDEPEVLPPQKSTLQQHLNLLKLITGGASERLDAGDLSIWGGADLPASDDGLHRSSYHLYYRADGGSYFLRFDDAITADLPVSATAAQVDAALEGLDGVTSAEVTGEPGNFTIALTADEAHVLQWGDLRLDGDGSLDYLIA